MSNFHALRLLSDLCSYLGYHIDLHTEDILLVCLVCAVTVKVRRLQDGVLSSFGLRAT